jgi:hypothetical protein
MIFLPINRLDILKLHVKWQNVNWDPSLRQNLDHKFSNLLVHFISRNRLLNWTYCMNNFVFLEWFFAAQYSATNITGSVFIYSAYLFCLILWYQLIWGLLIRLNGLYIYLLFHSVNELLVWLKSSFPQYLLQYLVTILLSLKVILRLTELMVSYR